MTHGLMIYQYITEIRKFDYHRLNKDPADYFKWFQRIASFLYHALLVKVLWMDKNKFLNIVEYLNVTSGLPSSKTKVSLLQIRMEAN